MFEHFVHRRRFAFLPVFASAFAFLFLSDAQAQRQMENLGRGVVAMHSTSTQAYVSWRLLGTDPTGIAFNVYRSASGGVATKLNSSPITATTDYVDTTATFTV